MEQHLQHSSQDSNHQSLPTRNEDSENSWLFTFYLFLYFLRFYSRERIINCIEYFEKNQSSFLKPYYRNLEFSYEGIVSFFIG
jgi:hypothetical protein